MTVPKKFQLRGVRRIRGFGGRALLGDEMGLGKSFQTLLYAQQDGLWPMLVICPAFLKWNWQREVQTHLGMNAHVLEGMRPSRHSFQRKSKITIINYTILGPWAPYLAELNPQLVVIDECQALRNRKSKQTKLTTLICRNAPKIIAASGTAMENCPAELFPTLHIIRPDLFPSFFSYGVRYCKPKRKPWGWEYKGSSHEDELHEILVDNLLIRRKKSQVLKELPQMTTTVVPLGTTGIRDYKEAETNFRGWAKKHQITKSKYKKMMRAEAVVKLGYLKRLAARIKMDEVIQWVNHYLTSTKEKIILFAIHKAIIKELYEQYPHLSVVVDGKTPKHKRQLRVDKFNEDPKCRIFIGQLQATGYGWSAKACSTVGIVEMGWKPAEIEQAAARVSGIGRGQEGIAAQTFIFVARNTIEEKLCKLQQDKKTSADSILDGAPSNEMNIYDELMRIYANESEKQNGQRKSA